MGSLGRRCLRAAAVASCCVLLAALGAGLVRLLPWLLAAEVPWAVSGPFALALAAVAMETALLVGVPIGFALGAAVFVELGEARALMALGASPLQMVAGTRVQTLTAACLVFGLLAVCETDARDPGRIAAQLIEQGRASCAEAAEPRSALVPMVGVTWLCFPGQPPRVSGPLPGFGDRAWFTASDIEPSDDLASFVLRDLRLKTRARSGMPRLRLSVERAVVSGLRRWGRSPELSTSGRAAVVTTVSLLLALLLCWLVIVGKFASRIVSAALAALPALAALHTLHQVDARPSGAIVYLWVPLVSTGAGMLWFAALVGAVRVLGRRGGPSRGR